MGDPSDTPPRAIHAHRSNSGEHDGTLMSLLEAIGRIESKVDKLSTRLAEGSTRMALHDERQAQQAQQLAALQARVDKLADRQDEISDVVRAASCETCEERIGALEAREAKRSDREEQDEKRGSKQPPWWAIAILSPLLGVLGTAGTLWLLKGTLAQVAP